MVVGVGALVGVRFGGVVDSTRVVALSGGGGGIESTVPLVLIST